MIESENEKRYRSAINCISATMLVFLALTNTFGLIGEGLIMLWEQFSNELFVDIATALTDAITYILGFMLPVCFYKLLAGKKTVEPMKLSPRLPRATFLYIMAGMAVILAFSYLNYYMISFTNYAAYAEENLWKESYDTPHAVVLSFLTMALIPAFVEEFLFRGLVQSNLRPFGRGVAIIGSAVVFGAMHQNIQQIFYATVAGLVFGYLYEETGSIWCGVLLHLFNNGFSVLESTIQQYWDQTSADRICILLEGAIYGIGAICLVLLICRRRRAPDFSNGCFEKTLPEAPTYTPYELDSARKVRIFFSPLMIAYFAICISTMMLYVLMALIQYGI